MRPEGWRRPTAVKAPDMPPTETRMTETLGEIHPPPTGASDRVGFAVYLTDIFDPSLQSALSDNTGDMEIN